LIPIKANYSSKLKQKQNQKTRETNYMTNVGVQFHFQIQGGHKHMSIYIANNEIEDTNGKILLKEI
jgi:hypothetical protein